MMRLVAALVLATFAMPLTAARVEIVLDVSGSMRAKAGDITRMEAAQRAVRATVEAIDPSSNVALRLYGHRLPSEPKDASCRDSELVIPFGPLDRQRFITAITNAKPLGQTPLAYALEQAAADFGQVGPEEAVAIILVSDGEESCGGDPAKSACALRARGLELTVHTVGFGVNDVARKQLQAVASCTGGEYRDANNAGELAESLKQLTQAGLLVKKQREVKTVGSAVRGGNGFGSAVPINPGTYRLDHHQRPSEYDYFTLDVKPGSMIKVTQDTSAIGVTIQGSKITENTYPTAGVALYAPDQTLIAEDGKVNVGQRASVGASVPAGKEGKYFVLIGQKYWAEWGIHNESPFTIAVMDVTDAASGKDAGDSPRDAIPIKPGMHKGWIQPEDGKDTYVFDAAAGATFQLRARPEGEAYSLQLTVRDDDGVELGTQFAPNPGAAVRLEGIKAPRNGKLYATVAFIATANPTPYLLELTAGPEGAAPAASAAPAATPASAAEAAEASGKQWYETILPGGCATCAGVLILLLLIFIALIVFIVKRLRRPTPPAP
jgi:hypothetical protein